MAFELTTAWPQLWSPKTPLESPNCNKLEEFPPCCQVMSVMPDSVQPHRWQPTRHRCPWDSPSKNTGVGCHFLLQCMKVKSEIEVTESHPTLSNPMDCSLPGSSIHGIFQARILEWGAIAFSNMLYRVVITSKEQASFNFMAAVTIYSDFWAPPN